MSTGRSFEGLPDPRKPEGVRGGLTLKFDKIHCLRNKTIQRDRMSGVSYPRYRHTSPASAMRLVPQLTVLQGHSGMAMQFHNPVFGPENLATRFRSGCIGQNPGDVSYESWRRAFDFGTGGRSQHGMFVPTSPPTASPEPRHRILPRLRASGARSIWGYFSSKPAAAICHCTGQPASRNKICPELAPAD